MDWYVAAHVETDRADILVASGARRMDTQDMPAPTPVRAYQPAGKPGLPLSPRPPVSPQPTTVEKAEVSRPQPTRGISVEEFPPRAGRVHTAQEGPSIHVRSPTETAITGFEPGHRHTYSTDSSIDSSMLNTREEGEDAHYSTAASDTSSFAGHPDALAPVSPPRPRDTIHNVIDAYDYRQSYQSTYSQDDFDDSSVDIESPQPSKHIGFQEAQMTPTKPVMTAHDLQPTREPSPQRYVHGEPLHFGTYICLSEL